MLPLKFLSYKLYKAFGFPKTFPMNVTLGLSYKCNSRCKTCNIWKKKDSKPELKLDEFIKLFQQIGKDKIYLLILTGGEPFLHKDILEICKSAEKFCAPKNIVIPTNCLLGDYIVKKAKEILSSCNKSHITLNLSLDGIGKKHDSIRGVKDNFDKFLKTYQQLKQLEKQYPNFDVSIHSVISKFNYNDFKELHNYVTNDLKPFNYITEIAENRNELCNTKENITLSYEEYSKVIDYLIANLKKEKKLNLKQILRIEYYELVKKILKNKRQEIPCYAGIASVQIDPTGEVWFCCVRAESIGNLRDVNYNLMKLWFNTKARIQRKKIANKECYCPLASANYTNIFLDTKLATKSVLKLIKSII